MTWWDAFAVANEHLLETFPQDRRSEIRGALDGYSGGETERVRRAILTLARGDVQAVWDLVASANVDYRDLIAWAEYPDEMRAGPPKPK